MTRDLVLHYSPGACSLAVHVALEESGLPFETRRVAIAEGAHRTPEFLAINPRGRVPVLSVAGRVVTEVQALLQLVADLSDPPLIFDDPIERARVRELLAFHSGTVHLGFAQVWRPERFTDDEAAHPAIRAGGRERLSGWFEEIDAAGARGWMAGDRFSLADLLPFVFHRWVRRIGVDTARYPAWGEHTHRMLERPAVGRALAREGLEPGEWTGAAS